MAIDRMPGGANLADILDRVLDKGIVIDAWIRVSLVGIEVLTVEARVVVASVDTYLRYVHAIGSTGLASPPALLEKSSIEPFAGASGLDPLRRSVAHPVMP